MYQAVSSAQKLQLMDAKSGLSRDQHSKSIESIIINQTRDKTLQLDVSCSQEMDFKRFNEGSEPIRFKVKHRRDPRLALSALKKQEAYVPLSKSNAHRQRILNHVYSEEELPMGAMRKFLQQPHRNIRLKPLQQEAQTIQVFQEYKNRS